MARKNIAQKRKGGQFGNSLETGAMDVAEEAPDAETPDDEEPPTYPNMDLAQTVFQLEAAAQLQIRAATPWVVPGAPPHPSSSPQPPRSHRHAASRCHRLAATDPRCHRPSRPSLPSRLCVHVRCVSSRVFFNTIPLVACV